MFREVSGDFEWENDVLTKEKKKEEDFHPKQPNGTEPPIFSPLDPGLF